MRVAATYRKDGLPPIYVGHPLIEALPPILDPASIEALLLNAPALDMDQVRAMPLHLRPHQMSGLKGLFVPRPELGEIESRIGLLLRSNYLARNPLAITQTIDPVDIPSLMAAQGGLDEPLPPSMVITGVSGSGKSRSIRAIFSMIPQVIEHVAYEGHPLRTLQVTWLSVFAPLGGSMHGLLDRMWLAFDRALGLSGLASFSHQWAGARSIDAKLAALYQVATTFALGVLHVDDLQRMAEIGDNASRDALNLIIQWANVVKVPLVLTGTHKMARLLATALEAARRAGAAGVEDFAVATSAQDVHFQLLVAAAKRYQWLDEPIDFDSKWNEALFDYSLALPSILLPLLQSAQKIASGSAARRLTLDHLAAAYQKDFKLVHPALEALRSGDAQRYAMYEDLLPPAAEMARHLRGRSGAQGTKNFGGRHAH